MQKKSVLLAVMALGLFLTGISLVPAARSSTASCMKGCNDTEQACKNECLEQRDMCLADCLEIPGDLQSPCIEACNVTKLACEDSCAAAKDECKAACPRGGQESPEDPLP